jgi:hypothetical protein
MGSGYIHTDYPSLVCFDLLIESNIQMSNQIGNFEAVTDFPEQTVERQGSLVFCKSKSSEVERERVKPLERNERVCGESPAPLRIVIKL